MRNVCFALLLAASAAHAHFKCVAADGSVSYQDRSCSGGVPVAALDTAVSYYTHRWAWVAPWEEPAARHHRRRGNKHRASCVEVTRKERHSFPSAGSEPAPVLACTRRL